jgi:hypothetical protein
MDFTLYKQAQEACDALQNELVKTYGASNAGDARYDRARNSATPELRQRAAEFLQAQEDWRAHVQAMRAREVQA